MPGKVVRFADFERKSRNADAQADQRDPADTAVVIVLPVIRIERPVVEKPKRRRR
jgi:hypothetical protein